MKLTETELRTASTRSAPPRVGRRSKPTVRSGSKAVKTPGGDATVELALIGGFELRCDGQPVALPLAAQRLVAYLALSDRPLLRIHVAGALWLDSSEQRSCANLRCALWRLRGTTRAVVEPTTSHVGLAREVVVDLRELMALARGVLAQPADADGLDVQSSQLAGDLLPDWYDDWVLLERERLRQLRVHALELIARRAMDGGRYGRAIDAALTAMLADPLRESTHALLIQLHLAEGNRIAAMRQYEAYCERTRAAGLEPVDELRELAESAVTRR